MCSPRCEVRIRVRAAGAARDTRTHMHTHARHKRSNAAWRRTLTRTTHARTHRQTHTHRPVPGRVSRSVTASAARLLAEDRGDVIMTFFKTLCGCPRTYCLTLAQAMPSTAHVAVSHTARESERKRERGQKRGESRGWLKAPGRACETRVAGLAHCGRRARARSSCVVVVIPVAWALGLAPVLLSVQGAENPTPYDFLEVAS
jgi:hypothetical protein